MSLISTNTNCITLAFGFLCFFLSLSCSLSRPAFSSLLPLTVLGGLPGSDLQCFTILLMQSQTAVTVCKQALVCMTVLCIYEFACNCDTPITYGTMMFLSYRILALCLFLSPIRYLFLCDQDT